VTRSEAEQASASRFPSIGRPSSLILVVEDDEAQRAALVTALTARGHRVEAVATGAAALEVVKLIEPDVALLDLGLPDIDGLELCRHLLVQLNCPVIVVTADGMEESVVTALEMGADDYVLKPYRTNELLARVGVALRHLVAVAPLRADEHLVCGDVVIDVAGHRVRVADAEVDLVPRQFELLSALVRNEGKLMTNEMLARIIWGLDPPVDPRLALRSAVSKLRGSLGSGDSRPTIQTEQRIGYRLVGPSTPAG
jgi:DNA-binding response OmpR family regulator